MTPAAREERPRNPTGFRAVALVALASLSCATVRVPASGIPPLVTIRGAAAEPQVELWVESGKHVGPEEAAKAAADARAALEQALAGRRLDAGEQLLVVRAQGVSRTGSRRADQKAAVAGIVVVAVAVVAVVVVALVASQGKGGGGGVKAPGARPAPTPAVRPAPPPAPVAVRPPPALFPRSPPVAPSLPRPASTRGHPRVAVALGADVQVAAPAPPDGPPSSEWSESVITGPPPAPPPPPDGPAVTQVLLPPLPPLDVGQRGFFARDSTRLELTLLDRATGTPLWVKTVERDIDPRDARAVSALLDDALESQGGWEPAL